MRVPTARDTQAARCDPPGAHSLRHEVGVAEDEVEEGVNESEAHARLPRAEGGQSSASAPGRRTARQCRAPGTREAAAWARPRKSAALRCSPGGAARRGRTRVSPHLMHQNQLLVVDFHHLHSAGQARRVRVSARARQRGAGAAARVAARMRRGVSALRVRARALTVRYTVKISSTRASTAAMAAAAGLRGARARRRLLQRRLRVRR